MELIIELLHEKETRVPVSKFIHKYIVRKATEEILEKRKIIVNSNWDYHLHFVITETEDNYIDIMPPNTYVNDKVKTAGVLVPYSKIVDGENDVKNFIDALLDGVEMFLIMLFKRVKAEDILRFRKSIDFEFLLKYPYPEKIENQEYVGDP
jgi:hypothetical protein